MVAHRSGARIVDSAGIGAELSVVRDLLQPSGRKPARDLVTDRPGQSSTSARPGHHSSLAPHSDPTEHVAEEFAREIADAVERGRLEGAYDRLALVAAPRFLGHLRDALNHQCRALVVAEVDKNLPDVRPETIRTVLSDIRLV